jgi:hypothetical protein
MFAGAVVGLRFLVVLAWIAAALAVTWWMPGLGSGEPLPLGGLIPDNAESAQVAQRDAEIFGVPLTTDTLVVQRDADGLSAAAQAKAVARAGGGQSVRAAHRQHARPLPELARARDDGDHLPLLRP